MYMRLIFNSFVIMLALVCINPRVQAQTAHDDEIQLLRRIVDLLNTTADEAKKWDNKVVAARTQSQIADLIWDANPENARNYLQAAWLAASNVEDPRRDRSTFVNPSLRNAVRREVLLVARRRAPDLAKTWLDELVEESKSTEKRDRGTFDDRSTRSAVLLQMANELVAKDEKAAAELLIESLSDGVSFNFQTALLRIQQKDPRLAETVFRAALAHLRTLGMDDPNELLTLYAYLFTPGRVFGANVAENRNQVQLAVGGPHVSTPAGRQNPALAREFLELASDLLLGAPVPDNAQITARSLVSTIGTLLREVTAQLPEKAALLRARAQQLDAEARFATAPVERRPDIPAVRPGESKESFAERRVDLLEEAAAKGRDNLTRDIGYANAAVATAVERYQRGLDLARKIDENNLREGVRSWLLFRAALHFIAAGDLDEAQRLNLRNEDAGQRAVCFVVGAQKLLRNKDTTRASEWLREAGAIVRKNEPNENMARIALGIVSTYGSFDTRSAADWLLTAVKLMRNNKTPASINDDTAPSLQRISGITPITEITADTSGFSLQSAIAVFPADQFEQVLYMLNEITPPEARGTAVLTLCSTVLKSTPDAMKKLSEALDLTRL